jgi:hypothetical protein
VGTPVDCHGVSESDGSGFADPKMLIPITQAQKERETRILHTGPQSRSTFIASKIT